MNAYICDFQQIAMFPKLWELTLFTFLDWIPSSSKTGAGLNASESISSPVKPHLYMIIGKTKQNLESCFGWARGKWKQFSNENQFQKQKNGNCFVTAVVSCVRMQVPSPKSEHHMQLTCVGRYLPTYSEYRLYLYSKYLPLR